MTLRTLPCWICGGLLAVVLFLSSGCQRADDLPAYDPPARLRRPVAMAVVDEGARLLVANRRSGSISVLDTVGRQVESESEVGQRLGDMVAVPGTNLLLVVDEAAHELIAVRRSRAQLEIAGRVAVARAPVSIAISAEGHTAYVASLWARRISFVDIAAPASMRVVTTVDLPFSPRQQRMLPDNRHLFVADAFGGHIALIDVRDGTFVKSREWNAHNLHGLALSADRRSLIVAHQALMSDFPTTADGVHWGAVMMNLVRTVPLNTLFQEPPPPAALLSYLGTQEDGAGDPTDLIVTRDDRRVVTYAGTAEVGVSAPGGDEVARTTVGQRPTALALSPDQRLVYVANTFSDSISVVQLDSTSTIAEIPLGPQPELSLADRGEMLFHDARLSRDNWFSCHSCHTDGHSNGLLNDNFGDNSVGAPKRVLSLLGVAGTRPWAWNGEVETLQDQVRKSILTTMRGPEPTQDDVEALTAYLLTFQAPPSVAEARGQLDASLAAAGREIFASRRCVDCHDGPAYTAEGAFDVDVHDALGNRNFNPPSLLGVSQRYRLFHDNRATSLVHVFREFQHGLEEPLSDGELDALIAFLASL